MMFLGMRNRTTSKRTFEEKHSSRWAEAPECQGMEDEEELGGLCLKNFNDDYHILLYDEYDDDDDDNNEEGNYEGHFYSSMF